jgi:hypothetical protein
MCVAAWVPVPRTQSASSLASEHGKPTSPNAMRCVVERVTWRRRADSGNPENSRVTFGAVPMAISIQGAWNSYSAGFLGIWLGRAGAGLSACCHALSLVYHLFMACSDSLSGARSQGVTSVSTVGIRVQHHREMGKCSELLIETWAKARHRHGVFLTAGEPPPSQRLPLMVRLQPKSS